MTGYRYGASIPEPARARITSLIRQLEARDEQIAELLKAAVRAGKNFDDLRARHKAAMAALQERNRELQATCTRLLNENALLIKEQKVPGETTVGEIRRTQKARSRKGEGWARREALHNEVLAAEEAIRDRKRAAVRDRKRNTTKNQEH